jgi:cell volume regulation protein A
MWQGLSLATIGVLLTAGLVGLFCAWVLHIPWTEGLLLGAIVSSTDAAAVFSVLRSQRIGLKGNTTALLEFESGSNDPMAVFLTTAILALLTDPQSSVAGMVLVFVLQMFVGAAIGYGLGRATIWALNRLKLESDGLYPVLTVASVLLIYSVAALCKGSGFLAVYIAGMLMSSDDFIHKRSLARFHDAAAWLMQIVMFLVLGLLVFPSRLMPVAGAAVLISAFLIVIARPVAVLASLAAARLRFRQKLFISWVGLRGAVPIVLATFPYLAGLPRADLYFNVVFFIVLTSILVQGTTLAPVARLLRLNMPVPLRRQYPLEFVPAAKTNSEVIEIELPVDSAAIGKRIMDLDFPKSALVLLVGRGDDFIAPRGATVLEPGDSLLVLADRRELEQTRAALAID